MARRLPTLGGAPAVDRGESSAFPWPEHVTALAVASARPGADTRALAAPWFEVLAVREAGAGASGAHGDGVRGVFAVPARGPSSLRELTDASGRVDAIVEVGEGSVAAVLGPWVAALPAGSKLLLAGIELAVTTRGVPLALITEGLSATRWHPQARALSDRAVLVADSVSPAVRAAMVDAVFARP